MSKGGKPNNVSRDPTTKITCTHRHHDNNRNASARYLGYQTQHAHAATIATLGIVALQRLPGDAAVAKSTPPCVTMDTNHRYHGNTYHIYYVITLYYHHAIIIIIYVHYIMRHRCYDDTDLIIPGI